jgi:hypothetical protein
MDLRLATLVLLRRRAKFGFSFGNNVQSFGIGLFAVAGFTPVLLTAFELLFGALHIDLFRLQRVVRKNGNAVRQHLDKAPVDVVAGVAGNRRRGA